MDNILYLCKKLKCIKYAVQDNALDTYTIQFLQIYNYDKLHQQKQISI